MQDLKRQTVFTTEELIGLVKDDPNQSCFYLNELIVEAVQGDREAERFLVEVLESSDNQFELYPALSGLYLLQNPEPATSRAINDFQENCSHQELVRLVEENSKKFGDE